MKIRFLEVLLSGLRRLWFIFVATLVVFLPLFFLQAGVDELFPEGALSKLEGIFKADGVIVQAAVGLLLVVVMLAGVLWAGLVYPWLIRTHLHLPGRRDKF